ncbi:hypothetical protein [Allocoleopsis sp.]
MDSFYEWAKKVNELMLEADYDCLFSDEEFEELKKGNEVKQQLLLKKMP